MMSTTKRNLAAIFFSLFFLISVSQTYGASGQATGSIVDAHNNPVAQSSVVFLDTATGRPVATATADSNGQYFLIVPEGKYTIKVIPPITSGLSPQTEDNLVVGTKSVINVTLSPSANSAMQIKLFPQIFLIVCIPIFLAFILYILLRKRI